MLDGVVSLYQGSVWHRGAAYYLWGPL